MPHANCVILFAKPPVAGRCKTRLGASIGMHPAAQFYKSCAEHLFLDMAGCKEWETVVMYSDAADQEAMLDWLRNCGVQELPTLPQCPDPDLGQRMLHAITSHLDKGYKKVAIIGTDIPDLTPRIVTQAFKALDQYELVLGPAVDGGYFLIGATRMPDAIFQGITWSTSEVYARTESNAVHLGATIAPAISLPVLQDIDTVEDLCAWVKATEVSHPTHVLLTCTKEILAERLEKPPA